VERVGLVDLVYIYESDASMLSPSTYIIWNDIICRQLDQKRVSHTSDEARAEPNCFDAFHCVEISDWAHRDVGVGRTGRVLYFRKK
jgi:hypothetical protein